MSTLPQLEDDIVPFWSLPEGDPPPLTEVPYTLRDDGPKLFYDPALEQPHGLLDYDAVLDLVSDPYLFPSMCLIMNERTSRPSFLEPTRYQKWFLWAIHTNRWVIVDKFRQAYVTTVALTWLLRDCMYYEGLNGVLIACDDDTAKKAFDRLMYMYDNLPDHVRVPLKKGYKGSVREIKFCHGGGIHIVTASGHAPAIGEGVDRMVVTEWGFARWQSRAASHIFPTVYRRPHARVVVESTPGADKSHHQSMVFSALKGQQERGGWMEPVANEIDGLFAAPTFYSLFMEWWKEPSCRSAVPEGFVPDEREREMMRRCRGMTLENVAFARPIRESIFFGDWRLFDSKYPPTPYNGWYGSSRPIMPEDAIVDLLRKAVPDRLINYLEGAGCHVLDMPDNRTGNYLVIGDPCGLGDVRDLGRDPAALTVWDADTWTEAAFWEGREEPDLFAERLHRVAWFFRGRLGPALTAPESNDTACAVTLVRLGNYDGGIRQRIYWTGRGHPGWYATSQRLSQSETLCVQYLRDGSLKPRSAGTLDQLKLYDGSWRHRRVRQSDGEGVHHFDRARTVIIAADLLRLRSVDAARGLPEIGLPPRAIGSMQSETTSEATELELERLHKDDIVAFSYNMFEQMERAEEARLNNPLIPWSRRQEKSGW